MKNNNNDYEDFFFDDDQDYELDWNFGELNDHKKRDKANRIVTAISLALIAIMLIGLCLQVFGKGKVKPSEWLGKSDSQTEQTMDNITAMRFMSASLRSASSATTYFDFDAWKNEYGTSNFSRDYGEQASNFRYSSEVYLFVNGDRMDESIYVKMYVFKKADNIYNLFICFDINDKNVPSYTPDCLEYDDYRDSDKVTVIDPYMYLFVFDRLLGMDYRLYVYQQALELPPEPTKDGYTVGWYLDEALTIPYKGEPITADMDFYAKFEINRYTVTFDSNGGSDIPSKSVDWNTAVATETPTRTGYNFKGWFLSDGTKYTDQPVKENTTLTARWEIVMCTVTFYVDGVKYDELSVEYGASLVSVVKRANELNLQVMSVKASNGEHITHFEDQVVSDDVEVQAEVMTGADKVKNTVRNNTQAILGGVLGGVALIAAVAVLAGVVKRKRT